MMLEIIFIVMTLAVLAALLFPLLVRRGETPRRVDYDIFVYRDQLAEIDKDVARGFLTSDQAESARAEIYRRMLAAEDAEAALNVAGEEDGRARRGKLIPALAILIILPIGAGLVYAYLGSPELPGKPYAQRASQPDFMMAKEAERLAAQLESKPDAEGFRQLADTYFTLRRYDQAVEAYQKVVEMNGGNATIWSELGETIALAHDDLVVPEARAAFVKALRLDPKDARARFYLGLSEAQINEPRRAVAVWRDLEKDSAPDAPWLAMVKEHIAAFAKDGGFDPASVPPTPPSLNSPHDAAMMPAETQSRATAPETAVPSGDAATAIMAMPPPDQQDMIHKMVDRLAEKMKANPNDLEGWERLAQSYRVLGETGKAKAAEDKAAALKAKTSGNATGQ